MIRHKAQYYILLIILIIILLSKAIIFEFYKVNSSSMRNTILSGDFVIINKLIYGTQSPNKVTIPFINYSFKIPSARIPSLRNISPGEIVLIKNNYLPSTKNNLVKRVAATEGQTITVMDRLIFVDGALLNNKFGSDISDIDLDFSNDPEIHTFTVPGSKVFVTGDNYDQSYDSRHFGFVDTKDIIGKVSLIYASFDTEGKIRWPRLFTIPG